MEIGKVSSRDSVKNHAVDRIIWQLSYCYPKMILLISSSSSFEKETLSTHFKESASWLTELLPTITEVTRSSFKTQDNAIWARVWPRSPAIIFNAFSLLIHSGVIFSCLRNLFLAARESSGIPLIYLSVSIPCSKGENAVNHTPFSLAWVSVPSDSTVLSIILYLPWYMRHGTSWLLR